MRSSRICSGRNVRCAYVGFTPEELSPWHCASPRRWGRRRSCIRQRGRRGALKHELRYLDAARGRDNLTILADTLVDRVVLAGDRAVGVGTSAGELRAQAVVLAACAYCSHGILLRSGVGPERELPVGEGLCDHVGVGFGFGFGFGFEGTQRLQREVAALERSHPLFMVQVTVAISSSACAQGPSDLFFFRGSTPRARTHTRSAWPCSL